MPLFCVASVKFVLADAEPVEESKDAEAVVVEQSEEVVEKPKKKKSSRWRRVLTFLHIRKGYLNYVLWSVCTDILNVISENEIDVPVMTFEVVPFAAVLSETETACIS